MTGYSALRHRALVYEKLPQPRYKPCIRQGMSVSHEYR
jgi:hypothetical protein